MKERVSITVCLAFLGLFLVPGTTWPQTPTVDLELELIEPPPFATPPLSSGTIAFQLTNHGPGTAGIPFMGLPTLIIATETVPIDPVFGPHIWFYWNPDSDCLYLLFDVVNQDPDPSTALFDAAFGQLEPGESAICRLDYYVNTLNEQTYEFEWISNQPNSTDPNPNNSNTVTVFRTSPLAIPTLSEYALGTLALALMAAGAFILRRGAGQAL